MLVAIAHEVREVFLQHPHRPAESYRKAAGVGHDINNIQVELYDEITGIDSNVTNYKFDYTETVTNDAIISGVFSQLLPTVGSFLVTGVAPVGNHASQNVFTYNFSVELSEFANADMWGMTASVWDSEMNTNSNGVGFIIEVNGPASPVNLTVYQYGPDSKSAEITETM